MASLKRVRKYIIGEVRQHSSTCEVGSNIRVFSTWEASFLATPIAGLYGSRKPRKINQIIQFGGFHRFWWSFFGNCVSILFGELFWKHIRIYEIISKKEPNVSLYLYMCLVNSGNKRYRKKCSLIYDYHINFKLWLIYIIFSY